MRALITVNNLCYFQRMLELARELEKNNDRAYLYLHGFRDFEPRHRELCAAVGVEVVGSPPPGWFGRLSRLPILDEAASTLRLARMIRSEIHRHDIDVVIMPEDSPDYGGPTITAAAHAEGIPVAVLATLGSVPFEQLANIYMYSDELAGDGIGQRLARRSFPRWQYEYRGRSILRSPVQRIVVQELLRIAAPKPWVYYSGHADAILVESVRVARFCRSHDFDMSKVHVTGFVEHDLLAAGLRDPRARARLDAELGLDPAKGILLLALVQPHYIHGAPTCDFQHHPDMVEFIVKTVATTSFEVVVTLHPSMCYEEYRYIEDWGVKIARRPTVELVPLCEVYVASGSSTISWAVVSGKPVVNYDVYRYELSAYADTPTVITVQEQADFVAQIVRVDDPAELRVLAARAAALAGSWGRIDGNAFHRIRTTLAELVGDTRPASPLEHFEREGFALFPEVLSPDRVAALRSACLDIFENEPLGPGDSPTVRLDVFSRYPAFRWLWEHPPFVDALRGIFGDDFAVVTESAIHDSGFGGWHRDTESQEVHGERFQWDPDFHVGQVAIYLQDNTSEYGGGLDVVPRAHRERDPWHVLSKLRLHYLYHERTPHLIKQAIHVVKDLRPRPIDEASYDRRKLAIPSKAGDVVMFDLRLPHKASQPRVTPVPASHRKLALFVVVGRNNRGTRLYRSYIDSRADYRYLRDHAQPAAMQELARDRGFVLL